MILAGGLCLSCGDDEKPAAKIPGIDTLTSEEKTAEQALFPEDNLIAQSQEFIEQDFLGVNALDYVYTADYDIDSDIFKLFMTRDNTGSKYINIRAFAGAEYEIQVAPKTVSFDEDYGFAFNHPEFGRIVAGLKNNRLVGILGFDDDTQVSLFSDWVESIPEPVILEPELLPHEE